VKTKNLVCSSLSYALSCVVITLARSRVPPFTHEIVQTLLLEFSEHNFHITIDSTYVHVYNVHMITSHNDLLDSCDGFEWDKGNTTKNLIKHQVTWNEIEEIFLNKPLLIKSDEKHSQAEIRYWALGKTNLNRMLFISFTVRAHKIRAISAREQNKRERNAYEQTA
jgi:uncharacterized DUF497 family protein